MLVGFVAAVVGFSSMFVLGPSSRLISGILVFGGIAAIASGNRARKTATPQDDELHEGSLAELGPSSSVVASMSLGLMAGLFVLGVSLYKAFVGYEDTAVVVGFCFVSLLTLAVVVFLAMTLRRAASTSYRATEAGIEVRSHGRTVATVAWGHIVRIGEKEYESWYPIVDQQGTELLRIYEFGNAGAAQQFLDVISSRINSGSRGATGAPTS